MTHAAPKKKIRWLRYVGIVIAVAVAAIGWIVWTGHKSLDPIIVAAGENRLTADTSGFLQDNAMQVFVCGSSSPLATLKRAKTCIGVIAEGEMILFDVGAGSWRNIENWGLPPSALTRVFLTHFHSDHLGDLDEANVQSWIMGRRSPLTVYGPEGVETIVSGFNSAFSLDHQYRSEYGGEIFFPAVAGRMRAETVEPAGSGLHEVYKNGRLTVSAFLVDHSPVEPALGYRIDYEDRSIVISGDTRWVASTRTASQSVDILFHEAMSERLAELMAKAAQNVRDERFTYIMSKAGDYHTRSEDFATIAEETKTQKVVMYHLSPPPDQLLMQRIFLRDMPNNVSLAEDGQLFTLERGTTDIKLSEL